MPSVTSMRIGTPRSRSNCVCSRTFASSLAARGFCIPAWTSTGRPFKSVPSTRVSVCSTPCSRGSRAIGCSWSPSSAMISFSSSGLNTSLHSLSEASDALLQPSFCCTFRSWLACSMARRERITGLNKNSRTSMHCWSKCSVRLPALSRSQPTSCRRARSGASLSKYFKPVTSSSRTSSRFLPAMPNTMRAT